MALSWVVARASDPDASDDARPQDKDAAGKLHPAMEHKAPARRSPPARTQLAVSPAAGAPILPRSASPTLHRHPATPPASAVLVRSLCRCGPCP